MSSEISLKGNSLAIDSLYGIMLKKRCICNAFSMRKYRRISRFCTIRDSREFRYRAEILDKVS